MYEGHVVSRNDATRFKVDRLLLCRPTSFRVGAFVLVMARRGYYPALYPLV